MINYYKILKEKIENKTAKICIVGLGYVGLPLVFSFLEKSYLVYGFDTNSERIEKLKKKEPYILDVDFEKLYSFIKRKRFFPTTDDKILKDMDVIIICVPTPLRKVKVPDISYVVKASETISKNLTAGKLIILESTSFPTTTRSVVLPILEKTGFKKEEDFFLCFSSERINPGDKEFTLEKIPKVVGGLSKFSQDLANRLYKKIIKKVYIVSCPEVAETSKLLENTFRLVNIALINEFAMFCHKLKISIWEVIEAAKTKPFGFMAFYPGPGIGGHCIPADPLYLSWKAKKIGFKTKLIDLASFINRMMPHYVVMRVEESLQRKQKTVKGAKILILGVTYKKDTRDIRESPALEIIEELQRKEAEVFYFDPFIPYLKINKIDLKCISLSKKELTKFDCVILVTDHSKLDYKSIQKNAQFIFDTRNVYKKEFTNVEKL